MKRHREIIAALGCCWGIAALAAAAESKADAKPGGPMVTFVIHEDEYKADQSLPPFAKLLSERHGFRTTVLQGNEQGIAGLEALKTTDVMVLFARRKVLPKAQLDAIRAYLDAGHGLVALRTACHAFAVNPKVKPKTKAPPDGAQWETFDVDVLGCHYAGHLGNKEGTDVSVPAEAAAQPLLSGVEPRAWHSTGSLYKVLPLEPGATLLMNGTLGDHTEPIAWLRTYKGGRVFCTTLGHIDDFALPQFQRFLVNAVEWAGGRK